MTYLFIDESISGFSPQLMTMPEIAEYTVCTYPANTYFQSRIYRLLPDKDPERMILCRTVLRNGFIRSVSLEDRWGNLCDIFTFNTPAET